ncbi:MAG: ABC transporter permease [Actinomycetales bacterium]
MVSWIALAVITLAVALRAPATLSSASLNLVMGLSGCLIVASLGLMLIVVQGSIDLSVGAYITLSAAVNVHYLADYGAAVSFVIAVALCVAISLASGALITLFKLNALIVTLAVNTIVTASIALWMGQSFASDGASPAWLRSIALSDWLGVNGILWVALVIAAAAAFILSTTRLGRRFVATGTNPRASRMLGINSTLMAIGGFGAAGLCYAIAGALLTGLVRVPNRDVGSPYMLMTIVAVALAGALFTGGPASISSLIAACLVLQLLDQALALENLSQGVRAVVQGVILVLAVSLTVLVTFGRSGLKRFKTLLTRTPAQ